MLSSADKTPIDLSLYNPMGYIAGVFGVKGWIKIKPSTELPDSLLQYKVLWIAQGGYLYPYKLISGKIKPSANGIILLVSFQGIVDRTQAETLKSSEVYVALSDMPLLPEDEYYWRDLIGLKVKNLAGIDLGAVDNLLRAGTNDLLSIVSEGRPLQYIPFKDLFIKKVSLSDGVIIVDWHDED